MGTNFYIVGRKEDIHIGKRSAAGPYCHRCNVTLCKDGEEDVHELNSSWFDVCPICGDNTFVWDTASFTWAIEPYQLKKLKDKDVVIKDEYMRTYSLTEFLAEISSSRIWILSSVGQDFS